LGDHLDAAPHAGLARPDLITKPGSILRASGQGNAAVGDCALSLAFAGSIPRLRNLWGFGMGFRGPAEGSTPPRSLGMERRVPFHVFLAGVAKGRYMVPSLGGLLDE
jgi:hypothetical protein